MMSLRRGVLSNEPIAIDIQGRMDVEYGNRGPELSVNQQLTSTGRLSAMNKDEIEATTKQERYRGSCILPRPALSEQLGAEIDALEADDDVHSVSVISGGYNEKEEHPPCPFDCWLKNPAAVPDLPVLPDLDALHGPRGTRLNTERQG